MKNHIVSNKRVIESLISPHSQYNILPYQIISCFMGSHFHKSTLGMRFIGDPLFADLLRKIIGAGLYFGILKTCELKTQQHIIKLANLKPVLFHTHYFVKVHFLGSIACLRNGVGSIEKYSHKAHQMYLIFLFILLIHIFSTQ